MIEFYAQQEKSALFNQGGVMKVLVIGSGGREHSLVWKINQSDKVSKIFCAPGNAGIKKYAECVDIDATDVKKLVEFAQREMIDLTIVGPESSLVEGVVDAFEAAGLRIFGPNKKGAILEGSKVFTKEFLKKYNIPSADFKVFKEAKKAKKYIDKCGAPIVVKADGLAAGKGVIVASTIQQAKEAVDLIMRDKAFGSAGDKIVVEQCLKGEEASFIAFTDGKTILPLPTSQDHKAVFEGDKGPNTGGMGAYSPAPVVTDEIAQFVMDRVMLPTIRGMAAEGRFYKGMLYAGLMIDEGEVNVLEFNCRFGDPEAQPLLMRLKSDIIDIFNAAIDGNLADIDMKIDPRPTICVNRRITTNGGRVLGITAVGKDLQTAISRAYRAVGEISWTKAYYRKDIGAKALNRTDKTETKPLVGILMGSDSDLPVMRAASDFLKDMGIPYEMTVASAHRTPDRVAEFTATAKDRGIKVIIAGAGMAAHLAGVVASHTDLPVIGVPLDASPLGGMDALLATVQMPPGIPVATMGIGKAGAKNAAVLTVRILALENRELAKKLVDFRKKMVQEVNDKAKKITF